MKKIDFEGKNPWTVACQPKASKNVFFWLILIQFSSIWLIWFSFSIIYFRKIITFITRPIFQKVDQLRNWKNGWKKPADWPPTHPIGVLRWELVPQGWPGCQNMKLQNDTPKLPIVQKKLETKLDPEPW